MFRATITVACLSASSLLAKTELPHPLEQFDGGILKDPFYLLFLLVGISLLPFLATIVTSFAKIVVVLSIARQAIGAAQTPPNLVIMEPCHDTYLFLYVSGWHANL